MICFPNAKINIGLQITEKRPDGFHNINSIFYPIGLSDILEVVEEKSKNNEQDVSFQSTGIKIPGEANSNLCIKAYHLIKNDYDLPGIKIHLHKIIPIGAGLGGGSSDAAFFIKLLNDSFDLGISWGEMHHYARQLGSDCSFFVGNKPAFAEGKGDQFESTSLNLKEYHLCLVTPKIHVNTAEAYSGARPNPPMFSLEDEIVKMPISQWKDKIHNDFEDSIFIKYPEIKKIKEKMYALDAIYCSMSGSGSSVYGIFDSYINVQKDFPDCYVWQGEMKL